MTVLAVSQKQPCHGWLSDTIYRKRTILQRSAVLETPCISKLHHLELSMHHNSSGDQNPPIGERNGDGIWSHTMKLCRTCDAAKNQ